MCGVRYTHLGGGVYLYILTAGLIKEGAVWHLHDNRTHHQGNGKRTRHPEQLQHRLILELLYSG